MTGDANTYITEDEFNKWKSTYTPGQEIPEFIHKYMVYVEFPKIDKSMDNLSKWLEDNL